MHNSSKEWMKASVEKYLDKNTHLNIADIGSYTRKWMSRTYRSIFENENWKYTGFDIQSGKNVDVVIDAQYQWNCIKDGEFDVVISGQTMEHVDAPWLFAQAIARICKSGGICMVTAPARWRDHKAPLDCWRILEDGMRSLMTKYAPFVEMECRTVYADIRHGDTYFVGRKI